MTDTIGTVEAAEILKCSTAKVKMMAKAGELPILGKMRGETGAYLFSRSAIEHVAKSSAA